MCEINSNISPNSLYRSCCYRFLVVGDHLRWHSARDESIAPTGEQITKGQAVRTTKWAVVMAVVGCYETRNTMYGFSRNINEVGNYRWNARMWESRQDAGKGQMGSAVHIVMYFRVK